MQDMQKQFDIAEPTSSADLQSLMFNDRPDLRRTDVVVLRTMIAELIEKNGFNPQTPYFNDKINEFERVYAEYPEGTRTFISRQNQVPGYRTIIVMSDLTEDNSTVCPIIAVTTDGRLVFSLQSNLSSISSIIGEFNKNRHSDLEIPMDLSGIHTNFDDFVLEKTNCWTRSLKSFMFIHCEEILQHWYKEIKGHFDLIRLALRDALDKDVLKLLDDTHLVSIKQCKWLTGGDGVSREVILARQQAVKAYPILAKYFSDQTCHLMHQAIDARESLSNAIAVSFDVNKNRVKRLQGLTCQYADADLKGSYWRVNNILKLPEGTVPKNRKQFRQLEIFKEFGISVFSEDLPCTMKRLSENGSPWRFVKRMEQTSGRNVNDAINFLDRKLYIPAVLIKMGMMTGHHGIGADDLYMSETRNEIRYGFKFGNLLDWSERYHRNIARYEDRLDTVSSEQTWPGLFDTLDFGNGCVARELTSAQALRIQGKIENHCVGGYLSRVISGENLDRKFTLVFSIEKNDSILATAEIECLRQDIAEDGNRTSRLQADVSQNQASGNTKPCKDADRIAGRIVERLGSIDFNTCQAYLDGLEHARIEYERESDIAPHVRFCGFDPFDRTMMERAWDELSWALSRSTRNDGLDNFIALAPVNEDLLKHEMRRFKLKQHPAEMACPC